MSDEAANRVLADAQDGYDLSGYSVDELVDAATVDYRRGGTWASLALGFELGRREWVPSRAEAQSMGLLRVKTRD